MRRSLGEGVSPSWQPEEIPLGDGRILVLDDTPEGLKRSLLQTTAAKNILGKTDWKAMLAANDFRSEIS